MADPIPFPRAAGSRAETVLPDAARPQIRARQLSLRTEEAYLSWARTVRELLGHRSVRTTMVYTHVLNRGGLGVRSPADAL